MPCFLDAKKERADRFSAGHFQKSEKASQKSGPEVFTLIKSVTSEFCIVTMIDRDEDLMVAPLPPKFWLLKSEPDEFSIDDLAQSAHGTGFWDVSFHGPCLFNFRVQILA